MGFRWVFTLLFGSLLALASRLEGSVRLRVTHSLAVPSSLGRVTESIVCLTSMLAALATCG